MFTRNRQPATTGLDQPDYSIATKAMTIFFLFKSHQNHVFPYVYDPLTIRSDYYFSCGRRGYRHLYFIIYFALEVRRGSTHSAIVHIPVHDGPPVAVFQVRLLDNQGWGGTTQRYVFGKVSARRFHRRILWYLHPSNCGGVEHGKSAQERVMYTVYGTQPVVTRLFYLEIQS